MDGIEHELKNRESKRVRYAVVGLGHIAQAAVLPAFKHASENSELVALISRDPVKLKKLSRRYKVGITGGPDDYDDLMRGGEIDAVYIALPNNMHCEYAVRAAEQGVHVLCEKPMATSSEECEKMIAAAAANNVRLMIAYRLHFDAANLEAIEAVQSGKLGEVRYFTSSFSMQVREDNIRTFAELGGGPLFDIGIYCINAVRNLFQDEPFEVFCSTARNGDPRFAEVEEMASAILRFPGNRLASFTCSFGASDTSAFRLVGTKGDLVLEPAYEYQGKLMRRMTLDGKTSRKTYPKRDQFAPELVHFSNCVRDGRDPIPSGATGLADVRVIEALQLSARENRVVMLNPVEPPARPMPGNEMYKPPVGKPQLVHVESASQ